MTTRNRGHNPVSTVIRHSHILSHTLPLTLSLGDDSRNEDNSEEGKDLREGNLKGIAETLEIVFLVGKVPPSHRTHVVL
jgi:hypothetical protein